MVRCPFCAEEIQPLAVYCRYCGATKAGESWAAPALGAALARAPSSSPATPAVSATSWRITAVLFVLSAAYEVTTLGDAVPLFGALRSGAAAATYHLLYVCLFVAMGVGLWTRRAWGYAAVLGGTAFYTFDKLRYVLDSAGRQAQLEADLGAYAELTELVDLASMSDLSVSVAAISVACWWAFALYVHFHRAEFGAARASSHK